MTDEERTAIEIIKREIKELQTEIDIYKEDRYFYEEHLLHFLLKEKEVKELVLNLINKQEKAIDRMAQFIYTKTDFTTCGNIKFIKEYFMEDKDD